MLNSTIEQNGIEPLVSCNDQAICFHCRESIPAGTVIHVDIDGEKRNMCCYGCQSVAQAIVDYGLGDYYRFRSDVPGKPEDTVPEFLRHLAVYDDTRVQQSFVDVVGNNEREASLLLEGIVCPACIWLIESRLSQLPGVSAAKVNYNTGRARIRWNDAQLHLSAILETVVHLGFSACPYNPGEREALNEKERKGHLFRLGLSGLLGMQVMMISVALYTGDWRGGESDYRVFLQWVNLILTTPVVLYSAQPFFKGAVRDLHHLRLGMDIPVSLGILIAFLGSLVATLTQQGHVYFDSVVMFVFLLLLARYLEFSARKYAGDQISILERILPMTATRIDRDQACEESVPVADLDVGDQILVRPGETIPADAVILNGTSTVDESIITGESIPVPKYSGGDVIGGSTNIDSPLTLEIIRIGNNSTVSRIGNLIQEAQNGKPATVQLANRAAGWFVGLVLLATLAITIYWWQTGQESWLAITISMLVVSCPCALSLATPTAVTAASVALMRHGIAISKCDAVENLARATHFIFDKTGTLTLGKLNVVDIECITDTSREECIAIAAAIEKHSEHPVAQAIASISDMSRPRIVHDVINNPGEGISCSIDGKRYYLGSANYIARHSAISPDDLKWKQSEHEYKSTVFLADKDSVLCRFSLADQVRSEAQDLIRSIQEQGGKVVMLSGDHHSIVNRIAEQLGMDKAFPELSPSGKLSILKNIQAGGKHTAVIGDGINDAPMLAASHVSVAMGKGTDIARISADMILMNDRLDLLQDGILIARKTMSIIRQNIFWAITYNLVALPAAASGIIAPWMAAIGMSLSSLIVIGNASRVLGKREWK